MDLNNNQIELLRKVIIGKINELADEIQELELLNDKLYKEYKEE